MAALRGNFGRVELLMLTSDALELICPFALCGQFSDYIYIHMYYMCAFVCSKSIWRVLYLRRQIFSLRGNTNLKVVEISKG